MKAVVNFREELTKELSDCCISLWGRGRGETTGTISDILSSVLAFFWFCELIVGSALKVTLGGFFDFSRTLTAGTPTCGFVAGVRKSCVTLECANCSSSEKVEMSALSL